MGGKLWVKLRARAAAWYVPSISNTCACGARHKDEKWTDCFAQWLFSKWGESDNSAILQVSHQGNWQDTTKATLLITAAVLTPSIGRWWQGKLLSGGEAIC